MEEQDPDLSNLEVAYAQQGSVPSIIQPSVISAEMETIKDDSTKTDTNIGKDLRSS